MTDNEERLEKSLFENIETLIDSNLELLTALELEEINILIDVKDAILRKDKQSET